MNSLCKSYQKLLKRNVLCFQKPNRFRPGFMISRLLTSNASQPNICVVGSGPAGFVLAQALLKNHATAKVDVYEKLPVPFGLIRYGVSPDHQDVKNCIHGYNKTAQSERFSFYGNVNVGEDVSLDELCQAYHAVALCVGAQGERKLGIPGENYKNVFTSNEFVGWYNGVPEYQGLDIDLSGRTAVIIGVGNVALDAARMLFKPTDQLSDTDITNDALNKLLCSAIDTVHLVGRRGPLQMACSRKELSEITDLTDVITFIEEEQYSKDIRDALKKKDLKKRKYQRLISYLLKVGQPIDIKSEKFGKKFHVNLLRTPIKLFSEDGRKVSSVRFNKQQLIGDDVYNPKVVSTDLFEEIKCDLLISCIGYNNIPFNRDMVPFENGKIIQSNGRINLENGLYACGWCSHGPKGVLADSGNDSLLTADTLLSDLGQLLSSKQSCGGSSNIEKLLKNRRVKYVTWDQWKRIDEYEVRNGEKTGKVRDKVTSFKQMLSVAHH